MIMRKGILDYVVMTGKLEEKTDRGKEETENDTEKMLNSLTSWHRKISISEMTSCDRKLWAHRIINAIRLNYKK